MNNIIPINDKYAIASDTYQWMVCKWRKAGKDPVKYPARWVAEGCYHLELADTITSLGNRMLREGDSTDMGELRLTAASICKLLTSKVGIKIIAVPVVSSVEAQ